MNQKKPCNTCRLLSTAFCGGRTCEDTGFSDYESDEDYTDSEPVVVMVNTGGHTALDTQVGGGHYKQFKIQPFEFITKNNLSFAQGNVIKYICRYKDKNGLEDLKKVKHYVDMLIELEYPND